MTVDPFDSYLCGQKLFGDDLSPPELQEWYQREEHAYYDLCKPRSDYQYVYHALNHHYVWRWLPPRRFSQVMGLGSAYGDEFLPVADRIDRLTLVDPCEKFSTEILSGVPVRFVKPQASGDLPFESEAFDMIVCFAALQHIPNVSHVVAECGRCLKRGGYLALRDSVVSMGDWRRPRGRLTATQRGIPLPIFREIIRAAGVEILREDMQVFPLTRWVWKTFTSKPIFNSGLGVLVDQVMCRLFAWNYRYHATKWYHRLSPVSASFVARKPE